MKTDYSQKEIAMIATISPHWSNLIEKGHDGSITPTNVYRVLVEECFVRNLQGPAVESLRRCMNALWQGNINRKTPEWDNLIQL